MTQTGLLPPSPLCPRFVKESEALGGHISKIGGGFFRGQPESMLLLATRSDRAGALSRMERALTVPRRRPRTPGPGLRLTSPASKRSKENSKSS